MKFGGIFVATMASLASASPMMPGSSRHGSGLSQQQKSLNGLQKCIEMTSEAARVVNTTPLFTNYFGRYAN